MVLDIMKKLSYIIVIYYLAACLMFGGCAAHKKLATQTNISDSTRVEIRYYEVHLRDTLFITLPSQSVERETSDTSSHLETQYASSDARINQDGTLFHSLESKDTPFPVPTEYKVIYKDSIVYRDNTGLLTNTEYVQRELSEWQKWQMRSFWILLSVILAALVYRFRHKFRKHILAIVRRFI